MNFVVTAGHTDAKMYPGMVIAYKVAPLWGIKMNWVTEITHVKDMEYFVDEQRSGPYALWHHQHHFKPIKGGVHMTDILTYALPYWVIGRLANALLVEKEIKKIFAYREEQVNKLFGVYREK